MLSTEQVIVPTPSMDHSWSPWKALVVGVVGIIVFAVVFAVMSTVGMRAYFLLNFSTAEATAATIVLSDLAAAGAGYLSVKVLRVGSRAGFLQSIGWNYSAGQCAIAALGGLCAALLMHLALTRELKLHIDPASHINTVFLLVILGTVAVEPLVEELYFRGILFTGLAVRMGALVSIGLVTAAFVILHAQHRWIVLPISLLLAVVRVRTKSTASCFVLHAAYNLGVVLWGLR